MTAFWTQGEDTVWVNVDFVIPHPSDDYWIGVFSPSKFKYACLHLSSQFSIEVESTLGIHFYMAIMI